MKSKQWCVYILECSDGTLYTGITNDLEARLAKHNQGKGARYTQMRLPVKLMVSFPALDRSRASKEEYRIKQFSRKEKLELINNFK